MTGQRAQGAPVMAGTGPRLSGSQITEVDRLVRSLHGGTFRHEASEAAARRLSHRDAVDLVAAFPRQVIEDARARKLEEKDRDEKRRLIREWAAQHRYATINQTADELLKRLTSKPSTQIEKGILATCGGKPPGLSTIRQILAETKISSN